MAPARTVVPGPFCVMPDELMEPLVPYSPDRILVTPEFSLPTNDPPSLRMLAARVLPLANPRFRVAPEAIVMAPVPAKLPVFPLPRSSVPPPTVVAPV